MDFSVQLSPRLQELLRLAAEGRTDKEIAAALGISTNTVQSHWKRLRAQVGSPSRTEIVGRALASEIDLLQSQRDRLLYEVAERRRAEEELREANVRLAEETRKRAEWLQRAMGDYDKKLQARLDELDSLRTLDEEIRRNRVIVHAGRYGGPWTKTFVSNSMADWGYRPEDWVSGKTTIFDASYPEDLPGALEAFERIGRGDLHVFVPHRFLTKDREPRLVFDFITVEPPDVTGAGRFTAVSIDVTDWIDQIRERLARPLPGEADEPLEEPR